MHELPITKSIFKTVIAKAESVEAQHVSLVALQIGVLRDYIPEIMQKYWDYIAKGSIAEDAKIEIEEIPVTVQCSDCQTIYDVDMSNIEKTRCPNCGCQQGNVVTGREMRIVGIEID